MALGMASTPVDCSTGYKGVVVCAYSLLLVIDDFLDLDLLVMIRVELFVDSVEFLLGKFVFLFVVFEFPDGLRKTRKQFFELQVESTVDERWRFFLCLC